MSHIFINNLQHFLANFHANIDIFIIHRQSVTSLFHSDTHKHTHTITLSLSPSGDVGLQLLKVVNEKQQSPFLLSPH